MMMSYSSILHDEDQQGEDSLGLGLGLLHQNMDCGADQIWPPPPDQDDDSIFYNGGDFPPLPDFPAMSSSSSSTSSSAPAAVAAAVTTSSSASSESSHTNTTTTNNGGSYYYDCSQFSSAGALSSTASMEFLDPPPEALTGGSSMDCCMDVMGDFGYADLLMEEDFGLHHQNDVVQKPAVEAEEEDLGEVFLDWLKNNKDKVSADDLRRIKIRKSTIDSAAKRLGGGREAMKQLLKLILEWVQTNHLHHRRQQTAGADAVATPDPAPPSFENYETTQDGGGTGYPVNQWAPIDPGLEYSYGVGADPFGNGAMGPGFDGSYQMVEPAQSWPSLQFPMFEGLTQPGGFSGYSNQYPYPYSYLPSADQCGGGGGGGGGGDDNRLVRLGSSATKEARKKRMARQRRFVPHHHHHRNHHHQHPAGQAEKQVGPAFVQQHQQQQGNLVYWPLPPQQGVSGGPVAVAASSSVQTVVDRPAVENQNPQKQGGALEKRKGWKPEKNLRFLLQKVLKQSDVGSLGRIVLPKKEAESHLPELEARDGISIAMEDIGTSRTWNMRYRFWPNNKSRMYLLENTGDFVRANGLQEGDFIVIYSDVKCGKYLIRGVKVRQPAGLKPESKKAANAGKSQRKGSANSPSAAANAKMETNANFQSDRWRPEMT